MMHTPYEGGSSVILQQDEYTKADQKRDVEVFLPPVGYVYQRHPRIERYEELVYSGVFKRSEIEEEQFWDRKAFLAQWDFDYKSRRAKEKRHQKSDPEYVDTELEDFREAMWRIRINGMWFMNNGTPVYLTGTYAFYLLWWKLDVGYPKFRYPDWQFFSFWQYCVDDPKCMGMVEATRRRQGKTMRSGCIVFDYPSSHREAHGGIQSKTGKDAQGNVYTKGVLNKLKHLPDFFVPKYDREKGKYPKSGLSFTETNKRGQLEDVDDLLEDIDELNSSITWMPADHVAYDGSKLHRYVGDEVGKSEMPINVYARHLVVKYCLLDDEYNIIGKAIYTTTVEEMKSGGQEFRLLWDASNQAQRDDEGHTNSGLYRYFQPADQTLKIDKYGMPDVEKARNSILSHRKKLQEEGDFIALASATRKSPLTVAEMFYVDPNECVFNAIVLNQRLEDLTWRKTSELYHIGNLKWVEEDKKVKFIPSVNGRWWIRKDHDPYDEDLWNLTIVEGDRKKPNGKRMAGIDPFSHNKTKDKRNSNGACYVGYLPDATDKFKSDLPIIEYIDRPSTAALFYEDMLMTLFWTGADATVESNKIGLINYMIDRGYKDFVKQFDDADGIAASKSTHAHIVAELEEFVEGDGNGKNADIMKCTFMRLITDLFSFDINDTEKNDASMAFAYYRIGCYSHRYRKKESKAVSLSDELIDVSNLIPM